MYDLYIFIVIITLWLLTVVYATFKHVLTGDREFNGTKWSPFSMLANYRKIMLDNGHGTGSTIYGVRAFTHLIMLSIHYFMLIAQWPTENQFIITAMTENVT